VTETTDRTPDRRFLQEAIALAERSVTEGGGPFGALVVRDGAVLGRGANGVTRHLDPTAHAEVMAIRTACREVEDFALTGATLYVSCEPCPMCLAAAYWARIARIVYAATAADAAAAGFDDTRIARELSLPKEARVLPMERVVLEGAEAPFRRWRETPDRIDY